MTTVALALSRRLGVPLVHTEHGSGFVRGVPAAVQLAARMVDLTIGRRVLRSANKVLVVSEEVRRFVSSLSGRESELFLNGLDVETWRSESTRLERFLFVGRLVQGKGWDTALQAYAIIAAQQPNCPPLLICGDGPALAEARSLTDKLGLQERVTFRGSLSPSVLASELAGSVLVNASRLAEGFQTSLVEAAVAGAQIVTTEVPGAEYLQRDGAPVRIVRSAEPKVLAEAMADALTSPLPPYSPDRVDHWDWSARGRDYITRVRELLTEETTKRSA